MSSNVQRGQGFLYIAVFVGGMTTLAVELSASRLLGNVFGASNLVWANVIGLMLLYLTVGYFVGGRWADRSPYFHTLYRIIIWAAFLSALIPLVSRPVLSFAADAVFGAEAALALGSFLSVLVLFAIPVTLLGCISPFAIRLAISDPSEAGRISGQIYALSTMGSLLGTFLPVLFLIPQWGTFRTFIFFAGCLYIVGFLGLWRTRGNQALIWLWMPVLVAILSIIALRGTLRSPAEGATVLYDDESAYNYIQVQEDQEGYRYLYLNEGQGVHSIWHPDEYYFDGTWDMFLAAPYFNNPPYQPNDIERVLVIGLAAGTIPYQYTQVYDDIAIDGIEIDPGIVEAASQYFGMNDQELPNLEVYVGDGRFTLNQLDESYSLIAVDAYRPPYIPWHLTTVEFFQELRDKLLPNGVVAVNVGRTSTDRRLVDAMTRTMSEVFPTIHAIDVPRSFNTVLVATNKTTQSQNVAQNRQTLPNGIDPILRDILISAEGNLVTAVSSDIVFTDDRAPVETIVDSLVLNFLLSGDIEEIR